jgi:hypothetical protein
VLVVKVLEWRINVLYDSVLKDPAFLSVEQRTAFHTPKNDKRSWLVVSLCKMKALELQRLRTACFVVFTGIDQVCICLVFHHRKMYLSWPTVIQCENSRHAGCMTPAVMHVDVQWIVKILCVKLYGRPQANAHRR